MFGKKKNDQNIGRTVEAPVAAKPMLPPCNCIACSALCNMKSDGFYHCDFCGRVFSPSEIPAKRTGGRSSREMDISIYTKESMDLEYSAEDIYAYNCNGVVEIQTEAGRASGLIISRKGFVLTNAHAILNNEDKVCSKIYVKFHEELIPSKVVALGDTNGENPDSVDLALLVMERVPEEARNLRLGCSSKVRIGQHVYYIGNSKGEGLCMTAGIVSDNCRKSQARTYIMTDAATNPGNSGGPLFNEDGEVIGVHVSARVQAVGMKYAIPIDTAKAFLNLIEKKMGIPMNSFADDVKADEASCESTAAIVTLVLAGVTLLVSNIEYVMDIISAVRG